ncbi:MAG: hypothetical protein LBQ91_04815 [Oscillospiraceae bacterium]|jgi:hypothetical protein|nr:hypothetical protein [Oscillospiraceae bacterium]
MFRKTDTHTTKLSKKIKLIGLSVAVVLLVLVAVTFLRFPQFTYYSKPYDVYVVKGSSLPYNQLVISRISNEKSELAYGQYVVGTDIALTGENVEQLKGTTVDVAQTQIKAVYEKDFYRNIAMSEKFAYNDGKTLSEPDLGFFEELRARWLLMPYVNNGWVVSLSMNIHGGNVSDNIRIDTLTISDVNFEFEDFNIIALDLPDPEKGDELAKPHINSYHPLETLSQASYIETVFTPEVPIEKAELFPIDPNYTLITNENVQKYTDKFGLPQDYLLQSMKTLGGTRFPAGETAYISANLVMDGMPYKEFALYDSVCIPFGVALYLEDGSVEYYYDMLSEYVAPERLLFRIYHNLLG